jgi:U3 small nucleolar RNA-associated protein 13
MQVWALAVSPSESTLLSAGADSVATFWHDSSAAEQEEANAATIAAVQTEQDFANFVMVKDYRRAIQLALAMAQPGRLLSLFRTVIAANADADDAADAVTASLSPEIDAVIAALAPLDLVRLLKQVRDWNANAKHAPVAQAVLHAVFRLKTPEQLLAAFERVANPPKDDDESDEDEDEDMEAEADKAAKKNAKKSIAPTISMRELLESLIPYSERHMGRVDRLVQESYVLDYSISEMDGGMFGAEVMDVE